MARTALLTKVDGRGRPGLAVACVGGLLALLSFGWMGSIGFVAAFCLALVFVLACGGTGAWMQLDRAHGRHPPEAVDGCVRCYVSLSYSP